MIYDNVKRICDERGLSFHALELQAGISNGLIDDWKDGGNPKISTVMKIAQALKVSVDDLLKGGTEDAQCR